MSRPRSGDELCLAVDVGGTKFSVGLVDRTGALVLESRVLTPRGLDAEGTWAALKRLVLEVISGANGDRLVVCGVGCGGPMSSGSGEVSPLNIPAWREFHLRGRLMELTGFETFLDNDAKALALAEGWLGGARDTSNYVAIVVSTGVGGGIVLNDRLLEGRLGNAGHIGHVVVVPEGRVCACGGRGCLEAEASGTAIAAITGGEPAEASLDVIERSGALLGRAVASVANLLDLSLAVVSGSVALGFGDPFFMAARRELATRAKLDFSREAKIERAGLGATGPIIGAAAVGWRGLFANGSEAGASSWLPAARMSSRSVDVSGPGHDSASKGIRP
ncbi:MAG: ROK family protein [Acidimicrobiales bacterium]